MRVCPACLGTGRYVEWHNGNPTYRACTRCYGTGAVEDKKPEEKKK